MVLRRLKSYLNSINYSIIIKALVGNDFYLKPWKTLESYRYSCLSIELQSIVKLFYCGESVENVFDVIRDSSLVSDLIKEQYIIRIDNGFSFNNHRIIPYMGLYIMIDCRRNVICGDYVWFGEDSVFLSNILPCKKDARVLDLCTGSGIQALILGNRGMKVTALEINDKAVKIAKENVILNDLEENVKILKSDLFSALDNEDKYDLIVGNPPFLPMISNNNDKYYFADGGSDGLRIIRSIVDQADVHLTVNGKMILIGGGFGDDSAPFYSSEIKKISIKNKWHTAFYILGENNAAAELERLGKSLPGLEGSTEKMKGHLSENVKKYYSFILSVEKNTSSVEVEVNKCFINLIDYMKELRKINKSDE